MIFQKCECSYCKRWGWPLLWKLGDEKYWFEIPKNGSASIKRSDLFKEQQIKNLEAYSHVVPIVIFRDPVQRFVSLFKHYFCIGGDRQEMGFKFFKRLGHGDFQNLKTKEKLKIVFDSFDKISPNEEVHHFYPQTYFIDQIIFDKFEVIPIENLTKALDLHRVRNVSIVKEMIRLNNSQIERIKEIYKDDYDFK